MSLQDAVKSAAIAARAHRLASLVENGSFADISAARITAMRLEAREILRLVKPKRKRVLTSRHREPPVGTVVTDTGGTDWMRIYQPTGGTYWIQVEHPEFDPESWIKIAGNYGPVTVNG